MEPSKKVKVEVLQRKVAYGRVFSKGELVLASIDKDGNAKPDRSPQLKLKPHEYQIYIPDQEFDRLLDEHGDMV